MYAQFIASIRVKEDHLSDSNEDRVKLNLVSPFRWIGTPPPSSHEDDLVSSFAFESQIMIREIEQFNA